MSSNDRINESIKITKKFINQKYYADKDNVDIFTLFDINPNLSDEEIIESFDEVHKLFHPDMIRQIPIQFRYAYSLITNDIVPTLNFEKIGNTHINPLQNRKDQIKKYQELKQYKDDSFYNDALQEYKRCEKEYRINIKRKEKIINLPQNKIISIVMKCTKYYLNDKNNYFQIFGLNPSLKNQQILNSQEYIELISTFNIENKSKIDEAYQDIFIELVNLFNEFDYNILHNDSNRIEYDKNINNKEYIYKFEYLDFKPNNKNKDIRRIYYRLISKSIRTYGINKVIYLLNEAINNNDINILPEDMKTIIKDININDIKELLNNDFNNIDNINNIKQSIDAFITSRINLLKKVTINTYEKYNINQVKEALNQFVYYNNPNYFTRSEDNIIGREYLIKYIKVEMLKIIIECIIDNKDNILEELTNYLLNDYLSIQNRKISL